MGLRCHEKLRDDWFKNRRRAPGKMGRIPSPEHTPQGLRKPHLLTVVGSPTSVQEEVTTRTPAE